MKMERIGVGRTAEVYRVDQKTVLKLFYPGINEEQAKREADIGRFVQKRCGFSPRVFDVAFTQNRWGIYQERIEGENLLEEMEKQPAKSFFAIREMIRLQRVIHKQEAAELGGQEKRFLKAVSSCPVMDEGIKKDLMMFIAQNRQTKLCHGDFHPGNLIRQADSKLMVIDWSDAYGGDPLGDIARTRYLLRWAKAFDSQNWFQKKKEEISRPILAAFYEKSIADKQGRQPKNQMIWELLVLLRRQQEGIASEKRLLAKRINFCLKKMPV